MESDVNNFSSELDAFMTGLKFCLTSTRSEEERLKIELDIVKDKMEHPDEPDFYELFEQYKQQGHNTEESEEMAWKVILGRIGTEPDESFSDQEILAAPVQQWELAKKFTAIAGTPEDVYNPNVFPEEEDYEED